MPKIMIKALSVNLAFAGRRFKTPEYEAYEYAEQASALEQDLPENPCKENYEHGEKQYKEYCVALVFGYLLVHLDSFRCWLKGKITY